MNLIQPNAGFKYSDKGNRIYRPLDSDLYLRNIHVALDGDILWDAIEICPREGWVDVLLHEDGDNTNRDSKPIQRLDGECVVKRLFGKVELGEVTVAHNN